MPDEEEVEADEDVIRLAVIGRPNVGKSSLVNRFLGDRRVIVSDVAGTTRDAIDLPLEVEGRTVILIDTAGMRRQSKVQESVEYYTALRSQRAAERADVALVVCDATDGVTAQDLRIAELAMGPGARPRSSSTSGTPTTSSSTSSTSGRAWPRSCGCARRC
ncbi:MAG: GTPase [Solirubrobacteraceae bacterium]